MNWIEEVREALRWLLHLHHGVSKGSEVDHHTGEVVPMDITDDEWKAALECAKEALAAIPKEPEMITFLKWLKERSERRDADGLWLFAVRDDIEDYVLDEFGYSLEEADSVKENDSPQKS